MRYVVQHRTEQRYTKLFEMAADHGPFDEFKCAIAYATVGCVRLLEETLGTKLDAVWTKMRKRWLGSNSKNTGNKKKPNVKKN